MPDIPVDEYGCPTEMSESGNEAKHCPAKPCRYCRGNSSVVLGYKEKDGNKEPVYQTSWDWCKEMNTCAATVDWDKIFNR